jgi:hypothetical protein
MFRTMLRIWIRFNPDPDPGKFSNPDLDPGKKAKIFKGMTKKFSHFFKNVT